MKRKFKLIYQGNDFADAEQAGLDFWKDATPTQKVNAVWDLVKLDVKLKGLPNSALRLLRTTAVIKRS